jgi:hypothetical protein
VAKIEHVHQVPEDLLAPTDDGASEHLPEMQHSSGPLMSTAGEPVDLAALPGKAVVCCYPMSSRPGKDLLQGWDEIPGARGYTP